MKKKLFHQTKKIKDRGYKLHTHTTREISEMSDDIYLLIINMLFVCRQRCQGMLIRDEKKNIRHVVCLCVIFEKHKKKNLKTNGNHQPWL